MRFIRGALFISLLMLSFSLWAGESPKVDSLRRELARAKDDTGRVRNLNFLAVEFHMNDPDTAMNYARQALELAEKIRWKKGMGWANNNIGIVYNIRGDKTNALAYYLRCVKIMEEIGNKRGMSLAYNNIGKIYLDLEDYGSALEYFQRGARTAKELNDERSVATTFGNISLIYHIRKEYEKSRHYMNQALRIAEKIGNAYLISTCYQNLGTFYNERGDYSKALLYSFRSLEVAKKNRKDLLAITAYNNIGDIYIKLQDYPKAIAYLNEGLVVAKRMDSKEYQKYIYENLSDAYAKLNKPVLALESYKEYTAVKDSINKEEAARHLRELEAQYKNEKMQQKMNLLSKEHMIQSLNLKHKNYLIGGLVLICVLMISIAVLGFRHIQLKDNQRALLLQQQVLRAQINPHFLFNALNSIQKYIVRGNSSEAHEYLGKFSALMRMILNNSDKLFIPMENELASVKLYLEIEQMRVNNEFEYEISVDPGIETHSIYMPAMLIQPYVENAIWHGLMSKGSQGKLSIRVTQESETIFFIIEDNGVGRAKAAENPKRDQDDKPSGMKLVKNHIDVINAMGEIRLGVTVKDMMDDNEIPAGTRVEIHMTIMA